MKYIVSLIGFIRLWCLLKGEIYIYIIKNEIITEASYILYLYDISVQLCCIWNSFGLNLVCGLDRDENQVCFAYFSYFALQVVWELTSIIDLFDGLVDFWDFKFGFWPLIRFVSFIFFSLSFYFFCLWWSILCLQSSFLVNACVLFSDRDLFFFSKTGYPSHAFKRLIIEV